MGKIMVTGVKCAFLAREIGGVAVTAADLESTLTCKVLWGFGSAEKLSKAYTKRIAETYLAFTYAYDTLVELKQLQRPTEVPSLVVFDDNVDSLVFELGFNIHCFAQFVYNSSVGERLYKANREFQLVRNFSRSLEQCVDSFEDYENAGHSGKKIVAQRQMWLRSMGNAADTAEEYLGNRIQSLILIINSGW